MKTEEEIKAYIKEKTGYYIFIPDYPILTIKEGRVWNYDIWTHDLLDPDMYGDRPIGCVLISKSFKTRDDMLQYLDKHLDDVVEDCKDSEIFFDFV